VRRSVGIVIISIFTIIGLVDPADAALRKYSTTTTATFTNRECGIFPCTDETDTFDGTIASSKAGCRAGRQVSAFKADNDAPLGTGTSDSNGVWTILSEDPNNDSGPFQFYVVVAKKRTKRYICKPFVSPDTAGDEAIVP
jgi:hypothetical protein